MNLVQNWLGICRYAQSTEFQGNQQCVTAAALLKSAAAMQRKGTQTTIFLKKLQILATNFHYLAL